MDKKKILIIEDDQDLRRALNIRLRANNYETVFAVDGSMALSIARKEKPDLILLDLGLPGGDGFTIMERMRLIPNLSGIPVIVLTARDALGNEKRAIEMGAEAFFQKPVNDTELLGAINLALWGHDWVGHPH